MMDKIDVSLATLITGATAGAVELLKMGSKRLRFLKWVDGSEKMLALALPIVFTVATKLAGQLGTTSWGDAVLWALGMTGAAGLLHDKAVDPVVKFAKFLLGGKRATPAGIDSAPPGHG